MPLLLDRERSGSAVELRGGNCLSIGLVNNMPDAALEATERQFIALVRAAATDTAVRLKLFALPGIPRGDRARAELAARYRDISELWDTRLDGLIVTGTEPRATILADEPYWPSLCKLIDWARENTASAIWSCLAAHAAVLQAAGIERRPLEGKRFGVFDCEVVAAHPLALGVPPRLRMPHSRYNDLPAPALAAAGYRVLTRSQAAGVDTFVREERRLRSLFLFFQGHPEYQVDTLAREYRRDIGCFLRGERERYPAMPQGYFSDEATAVVNAFHARAMHERRDDLIAEFPMQALAAGLAATWWRPAISIYKNWIAFLKERKTARRTLIVPVQRSRSGAWRVGGVPPAADRSSAG